MLSKGLGLHHTSPSREVFENTSKLHFQTRSQETLVFHLFLGQPEGKQELDINLWIWARESMIQNISEFYRFLKFLKHFQVDVLLPLLNLVS